MSNKPTREGTRQPPTTAFARLAVASASARREPARDVFFALLRTALSVGLLMLLGAARSAPLALSDLDGTWLADSIEGKSNSPIFGVWHSTFTIRDGRFTVTRFMDSASALTGTLSLSPDAPDAIDINMDAVNTADKDDPGTAYPKCVLPARAKLVAGHLTLCLSAGAERARPPDFAPVARNSYVVTLARAPENFAGFSPSVTLTVLDPSGQPVAAEVFNYMAPAQMPTTHPTSRPVLFDALGKSGPDGKVTLPYDKLRYSALAARDPARHLIGITTSSPALLQSGQATVTLQPECHVSGTMVCDNLAGRPLGWTNAYLLVGGQRIGHCDSLSGNFDFIAPPGHYVIHAYGNDLGAAHVPITIFAGQPALTVPPINLTLCKLAQIVDHPAPELENVLAWKGPPTTLASLRGKYVLLHFWGYWCGPCIHEMPVLFALHDRFKDKGLAIIGVHVDTAGEVDTVAKLDEKLVPIREKLWANREPPFPVAITSGKSFDLPSGESQRGATAAQFGILNYPTTLLIDPDGKLVRQLFDGDEKRAVAEIEKLLAAKP